MLVQRFKIDKGTEQDLDDHFDEAVTQLRTRCYLMIAHEKIDYITRQTVR